MLSSLIFFKLLPYFIQLLKKLYKAVFYTHIVSFRVPFPFDLRLKDINEYYIAVLNEIEVQYERGRIIRGETSLYL